MTSNTNERNPSTAPDYKRIMQHSKTRTRAQIINAVLTKVVDPNNVSLSILFKGGTSLRNSVGAYS
ncbi:MAG: hypothetical protein ACQKBV_05570 [Puniceicoccales bacterium]